MIKVSETKIFAGSPDFAGRGAQVERLLRHANGGESRGLVLLAAPSAGVSELLRHCCDLLFKDQGAIIPFYFELRASDGTARNAARRFLSEFLVQSVAFTRRDPRIIAASPDIAELAELALPQDGRWIDRLVEIYQNENPAVDGGSFIRNCLSAPVRAASFGTRAVIMIDDVHIAADLDGGDAFIDDLVRILGRGSVPFVFAGPRRSLFAKTSFETLAVEPLSFDEGGKLAEVLAARTGVVINDQTRDLIAVQLGGNARHLTSLFEAADVGGRDLNSFEHVEQTYTDEIFGGRIGRYYDAIFYRLIPDAGIQTSVLRLLSETIKASSNKIPLSYWNRHAGITGARLGAMLDGLHSSEIVSVDSGIVTFDAGNLPLSDYIRTRARLEIDGQSRARAVGEALSNNVKRAPQLMARYYRQNAAIGLRRLMSAFDGGRISTALIDYARFKAELKGADEEHLNAVLADDKHGIDLPRIIYAAHTSAFYPALNELCDSERSAIALGFEITPEKEEIAWIAAEIDSKLEATADTARFWCDRLEMAAVSCNFERFQLWLIAREGFDDSAIEVLRERNAFGSSRRQVDLLAATLNLSAAQTEEKPGSEYELVVPMGDDTEMIAAHAIEEIAKRHNFPAKAINQIKTALVEACINATEHSLSPDRRIYQKFTVNADKLTITVSNRGVRLEDKNSREISPSNGRRGWGLKLIKGLMDEVKMDQTDDGTRVTMVKYLQTHQPILADPKRI